MCFRFEELEEQQRQLKLHQTMSHAPSNGATNATTSTLLHDVHSLMSEDCENVSNSLNSTSTVMDQPCSTSISPSLSSLGKSGTAFSIDFHNSAFNNTNNDKAINNEGPNSKSSTNGNHDMASSILLNRYLASSPSPSGLALQLNQILKQGNSNSSSSIAQPPATSPSTSSVYSRIVHSVLFWAIVTSTLLVVLESIPVVQHSKFAMTLLTIVEFVSVLVLLLEYASRLYGCCCSSNWNNSTILLFVLSPMNVIDLLSFAPFYLEVLLYVMGLYNETQHVLSLLKMARLFRLLRLMRYSDKLTLIFRAIYQSRDILASIALFVSSAIMISSALMYYLERGDYDPVRNVHVRSDGTMSPYESIPASMFWSVSVLATVGTSDDFIPRTLPGKMVAFMLMMFSIMLIALPSITISKSYKEILAQYVESQRTIEKNHNDNENCNGDGDRDDNHVFNTVEKGDDDDMVDGLIHAMKSQIKLLVVKQEETQQMIHQLSNNLQTLSKLQNRKQQQQATIKIL